MKKSSFTRALRVLALLSFALAGYADNIPGLLSTGLGTACGSDPTWTAQDYASGGNGDGGALESAIDLSPVCGTGLGFASGDANWYSGWSANSAGKYGWIGVTATNPSPTTGYSNTFSESFSLAGLDASTAVITGFFDVDVDGSLFVNGNEITPNVCCSTPYAQGQYASNPGGGVPFTVPVSDLLPGANTISVVLHGDGADDGTLVYITQATAASSGGSTPEPASLLLTGGGLLGLLAVTRRRRTSSRRLQHRMPAGYDVVWQDGLSLWRR